MRRWRRTLLKADSQPEAELPLVVLRAGDLGEAAERRNGTVRSPLQVRHVGARIVEMRRIGRVERLRPKLELYTLRHRKLTEEAEIQVHYTGPVQGIQPAVPETHGRHRRVCQRVEVRLSRPGAAQNFHLRLDLIGRLRVTRRVQRRAGRGDGE